MLIHLTIANDSLTLTQDSETGRKSLFSSIPRQAGDVICSFSSSEILSAPTRYTLQLSENKHILLKPEYLWYVNHSCEPNIFFDIPSMELVCLAPIQAGQELRFFYPSTEWSMAEPFDCHCQSIHCLGRIEGAAYLSDEVLGAYRVTPHIEAQRVQKKTGDREAISLPDGLTVWVLVPEVETEDPNIDYYYDFSQSREEYARVFEEWDIPWHWQPVNMENYRQVIEMIAESSAPLVPVVLNLCDGDEVNGSPGISVLCCLKESGLTYTGADAYFYAATTSKMSMKHLFEMERVPTPAWEPVGLEGIPVNGIFERLGSPLIVKPAVSAGSMGISVRSVVHTKDALEAQIDALEERYRGWSLTTGGILAEQFIAGEEYTTLVVGPWDEPALCRVYMPVERVFHPALPENERFLSFDRLWEIYETETPVGDYEDFYTYELPAASLIGQIQQISLDAYRAVRGQGYGRVDLRRTPDGRLQVLEVNAQCGLSEDENYTSIGAILRLSGISYSSLVKDIVRDALRRAGTPALKAIEQ